MAIIGSCISSSDPDWERCFRELRIYFSVFMCMDILPVCIYGHHVCAWCLRRPESVGSPRMGVSAGFEPPRGC